MSREWLDIKTISRDWTGVWKLCSAYYRLVLAEATFIHLETDFVANDCIINVLVSTGIFLCFERKLSLHQNFYLLSVDGG